MGKSVKINRLGPIQISTLQLKKTSKMMHDLRTRGRKVIKKWVLQ
jgi:hypothetical protein